MGAAAPLVIAAIAATAVSTAVQVNAASDAKADAKKASQENQASIDKALQDQKAEAAARDAKEAELNSAEDSMKTRDSQRSRQKMLAAGAQGRSGTILTSPLGVVGAAPQPAKTLLGM